MRLYLSSFRNGNHPKELLKLLGSGSRTALILNAMDFVSEDDRKADYAREVERLHSIGLEPTEVDLRSYFGRTNELKDKLRSFDLIWVRGGNAFVLRRAFKQSGVDMVITELLKSNAIVYGGYSAGIDMLTPSLRGIELVDNPQIVPEGYDPDIIWEGLALVPYSIAPHYKSEHPESAAVDTSVAHMIDHHIPFIALRDGEVIIVDGSKQRVLS